MNRAYCRQPSTYKKQIIKRQAVCNTTTKSKSVWIACPIHGCTRPIVTTEKLAAALPMDIDCGSINYNKVWNDNNFRGLKNQILFHCINDHGSKVTLCIKERTRSASQIIIPNSCDHARLCSLISSDLANENVPDADAYQNKELDDYLKMYGYKEQVGKSNLWRNRKRLAVINAYGKYYHPNRLKKKHYEKAFRIEKHLMEMRIIRKKIDNIYDEKDSEMEPSDDLQPDVKYKYDSEPIWHIIPFNEPSDDFKVYDHLFHSNVIFYLGAKFQLQDMRETGEITSDQKNVKIGALHDSFYEHHRKFFKDDSILTKAIAHVTVQETTDIAKKFKK